MNNSELLNTLINVMFIPLLPVLTTFLIAYLKKKTSEIESNVKKQNVQKYIEIAESAIISSISSVNQTYVDYQKKNVTFMPTEQKYAFNMAKEKVVRILGESGMIALGEIYKDVNIWLENRIEYYVSQTKTE